jgi:hypothetical protein
MIELNFRQYFNYILNNKMLMPKIYFKNVPEEFDVSQLSEPEKTTSQMIIP